MNIGTITDVQLLGKMLKAAESHAERSLIQFTGEVNVDGYDIKNPEYSLDKAAELQIDIIAVKTRLEELNEA